MNRWQVNYVQGIELIPLTIISCGLMAPCVARVTAGSQELRSASRKLVQALRYVQEQGEAGAWSVQTLTPPISQILLNSSGLTLPTLRRPRRTRSISAK